MLLFDPKTGRRSSRSSTSSTALLADPARQRAAGRATCGLNFGDLVLSRPRRTGTRTGCSSTPSSCASTSASSLPARDHRPARGADAQGRIASFEPAEPTRSPRRRWRSRSSSFTSGVTKPGCDLLQAARARDDLHLLSGRPATSSIVELPESRLQLPLPAAVPDHRPARRHVRRRRRRDISSSRSATTRAGLSASSRRRTRPACSRASSSRSRPSPGRPAEATLTAEIAVGAALSIAVAASASRAASARNLLRPLRPRRRRKVRVDELSERPGERRQPDRRLRHLRRSSSSSCGRTSKIDLVLPRITKEFEFARLKSLRVRHPVQAAVVPRDAGRRGDARGRAELGEPAAGQPRRHRRDRQINLTAANPRLVVAVPAAQTAAALRGRQEDHRLRRRRQRRDRPERALTGRRGDPRRRRQRHAQAGCSRRLAVRRRGNDTLNGGMQTTFSTAARAKTTSRAATETTSSPAPTATTRSTAAAATTSSTAVSATTVPTLGRQ